MDTWQVVLTAPRGVSRSFDDTDIAEWIAELERRVQAGDMAATTATTYKQGVKVFRQYAIEHPGDRVGPALIRGWKAAMLKAGRKPQGVNILYAGVKHLFRWAMADNRIAYDPTRDTEGVKRSTVSRKHKREALTDNEVLAVLAQPDISTREGLRDRAMLMLMAYTGARSVEVQRATIKDLHSNGKTKLDIYGKGHTEPDDTLYLVNQGLIDAMTAWIKVHPRRYDLDAPLFCSLGNRNMGGPLDMSTIRRMVKGYYTMAGVLDPRKTTHSLRHSLVSNLIRRGVPPTKIMTVTRHKSIDTLLVYAHEVDRDTDPAEGYVDYGKTD